MAFETALRDLLDRYLIAYAARDASACAALYAPMGEIHSPFAPPARGTEAIRALHAEWFTTSEDNKRLDVCNAGVSGDLGFALLRYAADTPEGPDAGTSLNVIERAASGRWKFRLTSLTADFETTDPEGDKT
jgi:ketosteroid isomerase-like protein